MTRTRSRFTTLAVSAVTGLTLAGSAGLTGLAGPASAADAPPASVTTHPQVDAVAPVTYADRLVRAWGAGDRAAARPYATRAVLTKMFDYSDPGGAHWRRTGSQGAAGTIYVRYHDDARGGSMTLAVSDVLLGQGSNHAVQEARFSRKHPIGPAGYADRLIRAWGSGDHTTSEHYATRSVVRKLFDHADPGGTHWRRTGSQGAAGTIYVNYHNDAGGGNLTVGVSDIELSAGQTRDVYEARFWR